MVFSYFHKRLTVRKACVQVSPQLHHVYYPTHNVVVFWWTVNIWKQTQLLCVPVPPKSRDWREFLHISLIRWICSSKVTWFGQMPSNNWEICNQNALEQKSVGCSLHYWSFSLHILSHTTSYYCVTYYVKSLSHGIWAVIKRKHNTPRYFCQKELSYMYRSISQEDTIHADTEMDISTVHYLGEIL